jgi:hypothetical protein
MAEIRTSFVASPRQTTSMARRHFADVRISAYIAGGGICDASSKPFFLYGNQV